MDETTTDDNPAAGGAGVLVNVTTFSLAHLLDDGNPVLSDVLDRLLAERTVREDIVAGHSNAVTR